MGKFLSRTSLISVSVCVLSLLAWSYEAIAHPVAQGHATLYCSPSAVRIDLAVSEEQISVWDTFRSNREVKESVPATHADYIRQHLKVRVDQMQDILPTVTLAAEQNEPAFHLYHIEVARTVQATDTPCAVTLQQDFLREFEFAPGNPWEAIFALRVPRGNAFDTVLLASNVPLDVDLSAQSTSLVTTFGSYFIHGIHHILSGYDHLLFVAALVLGVSTLWRVLVITSVFTLAHTITLVLSVLDVVRLSSSIVEPIIAGSIVVMASLNIMASFRNAQARSDIHRLIPTFVFGLFHGLGFAGGLISNLPQGDTNTLSFTLLAFAGGVEVGHLIVVIALVATLYLGRAAARSAGAATYDIVIRRYISLVVGVLGMLYFGQSLTLLS